MASHIVKGPFTIVWGSTTLKNVEEVEVSFEQESNDYTTVDGRTITVRGAISASATLTFLYSDVETLSSVLPQFAKTAGEEMSSGETVATGATAIDVLAGDCNTTETKQDLDIISCGTPADVFRIKGCSTSISSFDLENSQVRTIQVTFTGEPDQGIAAVQAFVNGTLIKQSS